MQVNNQIQNHYGVMQTNTTRNIKNDSTKFQANSNQADTTDTQTPPPHIDSTNTKDATQIQDVPNVSEIKEKQDIQEPKFKEIEGNKNRITYGLKVIELMSDEEYRAFLWATEGMSESEKMLFAQSLYRFTAFYQGKENKDKQSEVDMQKINAQKAFGVEHSIMQDFIQRYKNAYERVLSTQHNTQNQINM
ncbi:hypothetical protein OQH61_00020 [Helicobacter sp. MIT 21-1697]|uniref:hypothetical protein n=1 Tax=Helicobacter sp. MIT 21-1697 TaxID=2993733 RepID=UPI00224AF59D|nr:hypothetical protein [Helicobacter sp. MIT 21-1697]MCX2716126.1 hypothetical protein [Helicobacter sp. MIT 21-1697]